MTIPRHEAVMIAARALYEASPLEREIIRHEKATGRMQDVPWQEVCDAGEDEPYLRKARAVVTALQRANRPLF